ncbi:hypothetical protein [Streptomyces sp. NPDC059649]|uniref:hypothetical protein n=1 Tax=Streptomyces sp. NPDC059649 TaxID=3346895 RepID=UPI0036BF2F34
MNWTGLCVAQDVLTVQAGHPKPEAEGCETLVAEPPYGVFTRQLFLGENLDLT